MASSESAPVPQTGAPPPTSTHANAPLPASLESTLALLTAHRTVLGYIILSRPHAAEGQSAAQAARIVRHVGGVFEGDAGRRYAGAITRIVEAVREGLEEIGQGDGDEVRFMRIRTKRHEIMISPDERYLLAVLHDPTT